MATVHERDAISWRAERIALPELHIYLAGQLATMHRVLSGLVVREDAMLRNLHAQGGLIMSERAMFMLGDRLGKQTATTPYEAARRPSTADERWPRCSPKTHGCAPSSPPTTSRAGSIR